MTNQPSPEYANWGSFRLTPIIICIMQNYNSYLLYYTISILITVEMPEKNICEYQESIVRSMLPGSYIHACIMKRQNTSLGNMPMYMYTPDR